MSLISQPVQVLVGTVSVRLIGPSPHRKALVFSSPPASRITLNFGAGAVLDAGVVTLYPGNPPFVMDYDAYGALMQEDVFAIGSAGTQTVQIVETLYYP